jgi:hypothetical protein
VGLPHGGDLLLAETNSSSKVSGDEDERDDSKGNTRTDSTSSGQRHTVSPNGIGHGLVLSSERRLGGSGADLSELRVAVLGSLGRQEGVGAGVVDVGSNVGLGLDEGDVGALECVHRE